jgi:hypothetical protein
MKTTLLLLFAALLQAPTLSAQTDTIPPTLLCKTIPTVLLGPFCIVMLSPSEFIDTVYDNSPFVELGIRKSCTGSGFPTNNTVLYDAGEQGSQSVEIWARDSSGNTSSCRSSFSLLDLGICDPASFLRFKSPKNKALRKVNTRISGSNCLLDTLDFIIPTLPPEFSPGSTWFEQSPGTWMNYGGIVPAAGYQYEVAPFRNMDPLNGVTTYDITLISKHVLGITPLDSPYKIIAADINQDGNVTTYDMLLLRKLILGVVDTLPNGKSWRFVPADYVFPNPGAPSNPAFPEKILVPNTFESNWGDYRFIGIKIGDVDFSADPD